MTEQDVEFSQLLGKTLTEIKIGTNSGDDDELIFKTKEGEIYKLYHQRDCCESVYIESMVGDLKGLLDSPILMAEEVSNVELTEDQKRLAEEESCHTWTFYKLATLKGCVDIRWFGCSNGYYSEVVDFVKITEGDEE